MGIGLNVERIRIIVNSIPVYAFLYHDLSHKKTHRNILFDVQSRDFPDIP